MHSWTLTIQTTVALAQAPLTPVHQSVHRMQHLANIQVIYIYIQKVSLTQVKNLQEMILTKQKLKDVWCFEDFKVPVESFGWAENALCCQDHLVRLSTCTSRWSIGWIRQRQAEAKRPPKFVLGGRAWREPPKHLIYIYIYINFTSQRLGEHHDYDRPTTIVECTVSFAHQSCGKCSLLSKTRQRETSLATALMRWAGIQASPELPKSNPIPLTLLICQLSISICHHGIPQAYSCPRWQIDLHDRALPVFPQRANSYQSHPASVSHAKQAFCPEAWYVSCFAV